MMKSACSTLMLIFALSATPARSDPNFRLNRECISNLGRAQQQDCDQHVLEQLRSGSRITTLGDGWQLVKTKSPTGGQDAVSAMRVVDSGKSDIGLAGLSLQCGPQGIEVILVTLGRLSRTDRPKVILTAGNGHTAEFEASVVQAGEALLLPKTASDLAAGDWQTTTELAVEIQAKPGPIRGVIPLGGLAAAFRTLAENCRAR